MTGWPRRRVQRSLTCVQYFALADVGAAAMQVVGVVARTGAPRAADVHRSRGYRSGHACGYKQGQAAGYRGPRCCMGNPAWNPCWIDASSRPIAGAHHPPEDVPAAPATLS